MLKRLLILGLLISFIGPAFSSTADNYDPVAFNGDGSTVEFNFTWPVGETADVKVIVTTIATGAESVLTETTDYSVSATNNDFSSGGTVTTVTTYTSASKITLRRDTDKTQDATFADTKVIRLSDLVDGMDKLTRMTQERKEEFGRAYYIPESDTSAVAVPSVVDRAGKFFKWDSSGDVVAVDALDTGSVAFSAYGETLVDDADAGAAQTTLSLKDGTAQLEFADLITNSPSIDPRYYDAVGDGVNDDTAELNAAWAAGNAGQTLQLPFGTYLISASLIPKDGVSLKADGATIKLADASNVDMIDFDAGQSNITIEGITFDGNRANQTFNVNTGYGINITSTSEHITIKNCLFKDISARCIYSAGGFLDKYLTITDNDMIDFGYGGIALLLTENVIITGNHIDNEDITATRAGHGINSVLTTDLVIADNTVVLASSGSTSANAIGCRDGKQVVISNNTINANDNSAIAGIGVDCDTVDSDYVIEGNDITNCGERGGIEINGDSDFEIVSAVINDNVITSCPVPGIAITGLGLDNITASVNTIKDCGTSTGSIYVNAAEELTNINIIGNIVKDSLARGIYFNGGPIDSTIIGNIITGSTNAGIELVATSDDSFPISDVTVSNNICINGSAKGFNMAGTDFSGIIVTNNNFSDNTTASTTKVSESADFEDRNIFSGNLGLVVGGITITDTVELTSTNIKALVGTPITLVPARGADTAIEFISAVLIHDAGTAYVEPSAPDDMVIEYDTGTDLSASIDATNFLTVTDDEIRLVPSTLALTVDLVPEKNAGIQLLNTGGDYTTGTGTMTIKITYRYFELGL